MDEVQRALGPGIVDIQRQIDERSRPLVSPTASTVITVPGVAIAGRVTNARSAVAWSMRSPSLVAAGSMATEP